MKLVKVLGGMSAFDAREVGIMFLGACCWATLAMVDAEHPGSAKQPQTAEPPNRRASSFWKVPGTAGVPRFRSPPLFTGAFHQGLARLIYLRAVSVKEEAKHTIKAVVNILDEERASYAFNMGNRNP